MKKDLHYTPEQNDSFRCNVPINASKQLVLTNGVCRNLQDVAHNGCRIAAGEGGKGISLTVTTGEVVELPVQIINVRNSENTQKLAYTNTFTVEKNAQAKLVICNHTLTPDSFETESVTNIIVHEGAHLEIVWMQSEHNQSHHCSTITVTQAANSHFAGDVITLHGAQIENTIDIKLQGEQAGCMANGLFLIDGKQHYSTDITITHEVGHCHSQQLFKGIVDNEAIGRFHGRVVVAKDAQKTEAYQANNNLLLTKQAKMFTQPQLEIYADDVKCSHGATIGQLDEQALFYMRSRGISFKEARLLQQIGFVQDVLDKISIIPLRERIAGLVTKRLNGEFSRCADCELHCC